MGNKQIIKLETFSSTKKSALASSKIGQNIHKMSGSNCEGDQCLCFHYTWIVMDSTTPLHFQPLAIFCACCTALFLSDLFGNYTVSFLMMGLKYF